MKGISKRRKTLISVLILGALICSIMVAVTKLMGAEQYTGMFALMAVGFAIITLPISIVIQTKSKRPPVSRVELLRKRMMEQRTLNSDS